jgi:hypothetical protein
MCEELRRLCETRTKERSKAYFLCEVFHRSHISTGILWKTSLFLHLSPGFSHKGRDLLHGNFMILCD